MWSLIPPMIKVKLGGLFIDNSTSPITHKYITQTFRDFIFGSIKLSIISYVSMPECPVSNQKNARSRLESVQPLNFYCLSKDCTVWYVFVFLISTADWIVLLNLIWWNAHHMWSTFVGHLPSFMWEKCNFLCVVHYSDLPFGLIQSISCKVIHERNPLLSQ